MSGRRPALIEAARSWAAPLLAATALLLTATSAPAQVRPVPSGTGAQQEFHIRGFGDVGAVTFTASDSFDAVLGSAGGLIVGGGIEAVLPQRIFFGVRVSRFQADGERVLVFDGERFGLGIDTTVRVRPIELTAGYRFRDTAARLVPYGGGGIGRHQYRETSAFATETENVDDTFRGYHVLGGLEVRIARWIGAAAEAQWTTVPDALGQDPNGVSAAFDEDDLGGTTVRVKILIGR